MACIFIAGCEVECPSTTVQVSPEGTFTGNTGILTRDTSVFRSGLASFKFDTTTSNASVYVYKAVPGSTGPWYARVYVRIPAAPGALTNIFNMGGTSVGPNARVSAAGKLLLYNGGTPVTTSDFSIVGTDWVLVELYGNHNGTAWTAAELRVNGLSIATWTGSTTDAGPTTLRFGLMDAPGSSFIMNMDDVKYNDSSGSDNNSWCETGAALLMMPTSDGQRGSWTGGVGGTTNLFEAVNNAPPIGTNSETDLTQIESADSSGDNATDEYRGDCGTYAAEAGNQFIRVNAMQMFIVHGEDVSTNTKTGSYGLQSNPSTSYQTFTYGNDGGGLGVYPTGWIWKFETVVDAPTVDVNAPLIIAARKTDTGTRVGSICLLGVYIDITRLPPPFLMPRYRYN